MLPRGCGEHVPVKMYRTTSEYKKEYGEDDIIRYYNKNGSYVGIEEYLQIRMEEREAEKKSKFN